jgi:prolyl 4-hydroxylase
MPTFAQAVELSQAGREDEAQALVEQLAEAGDPDGLFTLADLHWSGAPGIPEDHARGRALFERASDAGHPMAIRAATNLLASGIVGRRDWPGAIARLRVEAKEDVRRAQMLALIEAMDLTPSGHPARPPRGERISDSPEVTRFPGLFTPAECDYLRMIAETGYQPSMVVQNGKEIRDPIRTSDGAPMHWLIEDPAIHALNRRIAAASETLYEQGEPLLILRYRPGEQYRRHLDALPGIENPRFKTALVYLNQGYAGGETEFTAVGLKVKGATGDAIVFRNTHLTGGTDPMSEHCGQPVTDGVKYLASRWIRERRHLPRV